MNSDQAVREGGDYRTFLRKAHGPALLRRTAEQHADFLLPHLQPGMRLIDAGCGPGSITLGLARRIAPGEAVGVDMSAESLADARALAQAGDAANVRFVDGDAYALPFADGTFDAGFAHALLQHLRDPLSALRELRRVVRPGGVVGVADADYAGGMMWPDYPELRRWLEITLALRTRDGGTPTVGRQLRALLAEAGFAQVDVTVRQQCDGSSDAARLQAAFNASYVEAPGYVAHVAGNGIASPEELRGIAAAWRRWGDDPGAFATRNFVQAIAR